jgi:nucleoside phosphorylase
MGAKRGLAAAAVVAGGIFFSIGASGVAPAASGRCVAAVQAPITHGSFVEGQGTINCVFVVNVTGRVCLRGPSGISTCQNFTYTASAVDTQGESVAAGCSGHGTYTVTLTGISDGTNAFSATPRSGTAC